MPTWTTNLDDIDPNRDKRNARRDFRRLADGNKSHSRSVSPSDLVSRRQARNARGGRDLPPRRAKSGDYEHEMDGNASASIMDSIANLIGPDPEELKREKEERRRQKEEERKRKEAEREEKRKRKEAEKEEKRAKKREEKKRSRSRSIELRQRAQAENLPRKKKNSLFALKDEKKKQFGDQANICATRMPKDFNAATYQAPMFAKNNAQKTLLKDATKDNFVLKDLTTLGTARDVETLVGAFRPVTAKPGQTIVNQGESGKHLYVVEKGKVEFKVDGKTVGSAEAGGTFGELNMLFSAPEKADIVVSTDSDGPAKLLRVDQDTFRGIMQTTEMEKNRRYKEKSALKRQSIEEKKTGRPSAASSSVSWLASSKVLQKREAISKSLKQHVKIEDLERISVLGEGQFGEVWLVATHLPGVKGYESKGGKKKRFALKIQNKVDELRGDEATTMDIIKGEIEVMEQLVHPFISSLYHTYESDASMDMVLGLIPGGELWDLVHREDPATGEWSSGIPVWHAQFYAMVVCDTLAYIHSQKYVFRDLKKENIMIDGKGYPVIVDFGFGKKLKSDTTFTFCGTPNYVSPEIVKNSGHNAGADYWALGVVIYEMITGENPFWYDGMENHQLFQAIVNEPYEPIPKEHNEPVLKDLIDKLLEKDPTKRLGMLKAKAQDILDHKWFEKLDINELRARKVKAPWIPEKGDDDSDDEEEWEVSVPKPAPPPPPPGPPPKMMDAPKPERPKEGEKKLTKPQAAPQIRAAPLKVDAKTFQAPVHTKDTAQKALLDEVTKSNFMLKDLCTGATKDVQTLINAFEHLKVKDGETVVKQGDLGKHMYVVEKGTVQFLVNGITVGTVKAGETFGEMNLLFDNPEKATVVAKGDAKLMRVDQKTFRGIKQTTEEELSKPPPEEKEAHKENWLVKSKILKEREAIKRSLKEHVKADDLERIRVLGEGQFGEVWLVATKLPGVPKYEKKKKQFALKCQNKSDELREDTALDFIRGEIEVMEDLVHPFIAYLYHTYENDTSLDMLLGLIPGGELWDVIHKEDPVTGEWESGIPENHAQFYALVVTDALAYMHGKQYIFRDLKPENIMIDGKGYPMIVDFGFAKKCLDKTFTFCGTPNYVAPEIIRNSGHNAGADYWALGVVIYEMITGENPFFYDGLEQFDAFNAVCEEPYEPLPKKFTNPALKDIVDRLLEKDLSNRLGMWEGKAQDILDHDWFDGLDLKMVRAKKVKAPWIPEKGDDDDEEDEEEEDEVIFRPKVEPGKKKLVKPPVFEPVRRPVPVKVDPKTFKAPVHKKTFEDQTFLKKAVKDNFVLKDLVKGAEKDVQTLMKAFEPIEVKKGETIVKQGEVGKHMYVVQGGRVEFKVNGVTVRTAEEGETFGEMNLMCGGTEKATIVAADGGPTKLLRVDQATFKGLAQTTEANTKPPPKPAAKPAKKEESWLKSSKILKKREAIKKSLKDHVAEDDLERIRVLGEGQFGEVWLVGTKLPGVPGYENRKKNFALKCQSKTDELREDNAVDFIRGEIEVMEKLVHPFIAYLYHTYESDASLDMVLGLIPGGELWDVVHKEDPETGEWESGIPEYHAQFYSFIVADTLGFMHSQQYIFRDLKPENIMIDGKGYPMIVDFGFAKKCVDKTYTFCGTPNYVSPEIVRNSGHNAGADYWALGCVIYEMITGENPFYYDGLEQVELYHAICEEAYEPIPKEFSNPALKSLVEKLLEKDMSKRLGMLKGKTQDILDHEWFKKLDLNRARAKKIKAPWIPEGGEEDSDEEEEDDEEVDYGYDDPVEYDALKAVDHADPTRPARRRSKDDVWKGIANEGSMVDFGDRGTSAVPDGIVAKMLDSTRSFDKRTSAMVAVADAAAVAPKLRANVSKTIKEAKKNANLPNWMT